MNDKTVTVNTHLGEILRFNDTVLAYDMSEAAISDIDDYEKLDRYMPEVIIVRKTFPKFRKRQKNRFWKLKHFEDKVVDQPMVEQEDNFEHHEDEVVGGTEKTEKKKTKKRIRRDEKQNKDIKKNKDYEHFL